MPDIIIEKYLVFNIFSVNNFCRDLNGLNDEHGYGRIILLKLFLFPNKAGGEGATA